jgi:hypothetical protein
MNHVSNGDEDLLRQRLPQVPRGEVISPEAARTLALWFARCNGPGFKIFLASGLVTPLLYRELTYLYDVRTAQGGEWLDALVRYSLWQPLSQLQAPPEEAGPQGERP